MNTVEALPLTTSTEQLDRSKYQYAPLDPESIRLLHLYPGLPNQPIHCDLLVASLRHSPPYIYLSYSWGIPNNETSVIISGQSFRVTPNLDLALRAVRQQRSPLTIWVDALCINQDDNAEKGSQIILMLQIAQGAYNTIVWLGQSTEDSDFAMDFVGRHDDILSKKPSRDKILALNKALTSLFARKWWSRVWVVQDVITSSSVVVICGSSSTPFEKFVSLRKFQLPQELRHHYQSVIQPVAQMPFGDLLWLWDQLRSEIINGTAKLFSLMIAMRKLQCAYPHDMIYAPLVLCREDAGSIVPDYSKSSREVFVEAMRFFLRNEGTLPLYLVEEHQSIESPGLPSWVIDWSAHPVPRAGFAFDGQGARRAYRSCGLPKDQDKLFKNLINPPEQLDKGILYYQGVHLDNIRYRGKSTGADTTALVTGCRNWWRLYLAGRRSTYPYDSTRGRREAFHRTSVANRLENFAEQPTIDFFKDFKSWLEEEKGLTVEKVRVEAMLLAYLHIIRVGDNIVYMYSKSSMQG